MELDIRPFPADPVGATMRYINRIKLDKRNRATRETVGPGQVVAHLRHKCTAYEAILSTLHPLSTPHPEAQQMIRDLLQSRINRIIEARLDGRNA